MTANTKGGGGVSKADLRRKNKAICGQNTLVSKQKQEVLKHSMTINLFIPQSFPQQICLLLQDKIMCSLSKSSGQNPS